ncbi:MAG: radical SAM protein [Syntrophobacteraceae bacterium]
MGTLETCGEVIGATNMTNSANTYHSPIRLDDLNFMVSLHCPGACLNCNLWREEKDRITHGEIDLKWVDRALQSEALSGAFYFDLTGGESQLSPRYIEVVRLISLHRPGAFIHTNVSGWYPETHYEIAGECLRYTDPSRFRVDVSLDGKPENYRKLRFKPGGWEKAVRSIELLKGLGIITRTVFIVHKQNYGDIEWIADFAGKAGVDFYIGFSRQANLLKNVDRTDMSFTPEELDTIESMLQKIGYLDSRRKSHWLWAKSVYLDQKLWFDCYMGRRALVMDPYGNVFPCNELLPRLKMGNLEEFGGDLDRLLSSEQAARVLSRVENRECQPCRMLCAHKAVFPWGGHTGIR